MTKIIYYLVTIFYTTIISAQIRGDYFAKLNMKYRCH
jgi:hypothetical protein